MTKKQSKRKPAKKKPSQHRVAKPQPPNPMLQAYKMKFVILSRELLKLQSKLEEYSEELDSVVATFHIHTD